MALLRLERSDGDIYFEGRNIQGLETADMCPLRREMQVVFQDPFGSLSPRMSVGQIIEEGLKVHSIGETKAARARHAEKATSSGCPARSAASMASMLASMASTRRNDRPPLQEWPGAPSIAPHSGPTRPQRSSETRGGRRRTCAVPRRALQ